MDLEAPPDSPCAATHKVLVDKLNTDIKNIMKQFKLPWAVMAKFAEQFYTTLPMIADRWPSDEVCRKECTDDLGLVKEIKYDDGTAKRISIMVMQTTRFARSVASSGEGNRIPQQCKGRRNNSSRTKRINGISLQSQSREKTQARTPGVKYFHGQHVQGGCQRKTWPFRPYKDSTLPG